MSTTFWKVIQERTHHHWLELHDPEGWWEATVKWDGCVDLHKAGNVPFDDAHGHSYSDMKYRDEECDDYIHICDLDDAIARLQALREMALAHFG